MNWRGIGLGLILMCVPGLHAALVTDHYATVLPCCVLIMIGSTLVSEERRD